MISRGRLFIPRLRFILPHTTPSPLLRPTFNTHNNINWSHRCSYATDTKAANTADAKIEHLTDLYMTARDEFEMAAEETTKRSIYAAEDRTAAREEFDKLKAAYEDALRSDCGPEVQRRVGQRVCELETALVNVETLGKDQ